MSAISHQLEAVREARANAALAAEAWGEYVSASGKSDAAGDVLAAFLRMSEIVERELSDTIEKRRRAFDAAPVLQAVVGWRGLERRIVVAKPNARIDEPNIPESFYRAIRRNWAIPDGDRLTTREPYEIAVVDRTGRVVEKIEICYNENN